MYKPYREVEAERGKNSFHPTVLAEFRGKPCNLRRHFEMGTTLREIVAWAELWAANDPEQFIYVQDWSKFVKRSKRSIASSLCIAESMQILIPAVRLKKNKYGAMRKRRGWIVADHDKISARENGDCTLSVVRKMDAPLRKRGERRWPSAFPDAEANAKQMLEVSAPSALTSAIPPDPSAFESAFKSAFESAFPDDDECISDAAISSSDKELQNGGERKRLSNPLNPLNPLKREERNPLNPAQEQTPSLSLSDSKSKPNGQGKSGSDSSALVLELACIADDVCGLFDGRQQRAVADLLEKHPAERITELWREHWEQRKGNDTKKRFAVVDFLKTADLRLSEIPCTENV